MPSSPKREIESTLRTCLLHFSWNGDWSMRKKDKMSADGKTAETTAYAAKKQTEEIQEASP